MSVLAWDDVPQFPRAAYEIDVEWTYLEHQIQFAIECGLDLDPDYQRVHVWTEEQRRSYLEYAISGGEVGRNLIFACTDWSKTQPTPGYSLLDGKQRLETVRMFMRSEIPIFRGVKGRREGWRFNEIAGRIRLVQGTFRWKVVEVKTRADMLRLYLNINAGGTPHSSAELNRVRRLLALESRP